MTDREAKMKAIADLEREVYEKQKDLNALRRAMGAEPVADHVLQGPDGDVRVSELFGDRDDLIVIHNMGRGCAYCTLWADGFNGVVDHLEDRAGFVVVSPDPPDVQQAFAERRGWRMRMLSDGDKAFTDALGYAWQENGKSGFMPGYSTLRRSPDGTIERIAHASFGPGDPYSGIWHMFATLEGGAGGWEPKLSYG